jgi:hypothetical protein
VTFDTIQCKSTDRQVEDGGSTTLPGSANHRGTTTSFFETSPQNWDLNEAFKLTHLDPGSSFDWLLSAV